MKIKNLKMKIKTILFFVLLIQILSKDKGKLISNINVKRSERIKSTLDTYISDVEKMDIPEEIKDWVKKADLNERRVKKLGNNISDFVIWLKILAFGIMLK